jgi:hypothetical protein
MPIGMCHGPRSNCSLFARQRRSVASSSRFVPLSAAGDHPDLLYARSGVPAPIRFAPMVSVWSAVPVSGGGKVWARGECGTSGAAAGCPQIGVLRFRRVA